MAEIDWELSDDDMSEWDERKNDVMHEVVSEYEEQVIKLRRHLSDLIESSDEPLMIPIN